MFYYTDTGELSKPGELQRKVVLEIRKVTYLTNNSNPKITDPVITEGFEIVKEAPVSPGYNSLPRIVGSKTVSNRVVRVIKEVKEFKDEV